MFLSMGIDSKRARSIYAMGRSYGYNGWTASNAAGMLRDAESEIDATEILQMKFCL